MFVLLVEVEVRRDHLEEFTEAITANARLSVIHDVGCLRFEVFHADGDPTKWTFFEVYTTEDAWQQHRRSPHFLSYKAVADRALISRRATTLVPMGHEPAS